MKQENSDCQKLKKQVQEQVYSQSKDLDRKTTINALIKSLQHRYDFKFIFNIDYPYELIQQLLYKLQESKRESSKIINKYVDAQIQYNNIYNKMFNMDMENAHRVLGECVNFHNVWSSKNGLILLMKNQANKGCHIDNNFVSINKKKNQKYTNSLAILNKIPQNSIMQIKLKFTNISSQCLKFQKDDHIRLKLYPPHHSSQSVNIFQLSSQSIRCLTIDQYCMQKQKIKQNDTICLRIDLFNKRAQAYYNSILIKFNEQIKSKGVQIQDIYHYVPVLQFNFGNKNSTKGFTALLNLDFMYKNI